LGKLALVAILAAPHQVSADDVPWTIYGDLPEPIPFHDLWGNYSCEAEEMDRSRGDGGGSSGSLGGGGGTGGGPGEGTGVENDRPVPEKDCLKEFFKKNGWVPQADMVGKVTTNHGKSEEVLEVDRVIPRLIPTEGGGFIVSMPSNDWGFPTMLDPLEPWSMVSLLSLSLEDFKIKLWNDIKSKGIESSSDLVAKKLFDESAERIYQKWVGEVKNATMLYGYGWLAVAELGLPGIGRVLGGETQAREFIYSHELAHANGSTHTSDKTRIDQLWGIGSTDGQGFYSAAAREAARQGVTISSVVDKWVNSAPKGSALAASLANMKGCLPPDC